MWLCCGCAVDVTDWCLRSDVMANLGLFYYLLFASAGGTTPSRLPRATTSPTPVVRISTRPLVGAVGGRMVVGGWWWWVVGELVGGWRWSCGVPKGKGLTRSPHGYHAHLTAACMLIHACLVLAPFPSVPPRFLPPFATFNRAPSWSLQPSPPVHAKRGEFQ